MVLYRTVVTARGIQKPLPGNRARFFYDFSEQDDV